MDLADLRTASFPMSRLPDHLLAPLPRFPDSSKPTPVMAAQVNVVKSVFLLCVAFHHSVFDAAVFSTVMKRWSYHCTGYSNAPGLDPIAFDRKPLMKGAAPGSLDDFKEYKVPSLAKNQPQIDQIESEAIVKQSPLPTMKSVILRFPTLSLKRLKEDILNSALNLQSSSTTSTNDCLCALLWWHITRARFPSFSDNAEQAKNSPSQTSLGFAINGRSRCDPPLPETYLGNVILYGMPSYPLRFLTDSSVSVETHLANLAPRIRSAISSVDAERINRVIGLVNSLPEPSLLTPGFHYNLGPDLAITSWAQLGLHGLRFFEKPVDESTSQPDRASLREQEADWGCVEAVRIAQAAFDGLCNILPQITNGANTTKWTGLEVVIGLRDDVMGRLLDAESGVWQYAKSVIE